MAETCCRRHNLLFKDVLEFGLHSSMGLYTPVQVHLFSEVMTLVQMQDGKEEELRLGESCQEPRSLHGSP